MNLFEERKMETTKLERKVFVIDSISAMSELPSPGEEKWKKETLLSFAEGVLEVFGNPSPNCDCEKCKLLIKALAFLHCRNDNVFLDTSHRGVKER
jgi:hypothetical protein